MRSSATSPAPETTGTSTPDTEASAVEPQVNDFFEGVATSQGLRRHMLHHPVRSLRSLALIRKLPELHAPLDRSGEGKVVFFHLARGFVSRATMAGVTAVLQLPDTAEEYSLGASKQTLRRKSRAALKAGVHWRHVDDLDERRHLLAIAEASERKGVRTKYRTNEPVHEDLIAIGLWLVACDADDEPILLSVTPIQGEWAVLRYFRTFTDSNAASLARYSMTEVLVGELVARRVRHLADSVSPLRITSGLRHFQRMVGFRLVRVRISRR